VVEPRVALDRVLALLVQVLQDELPLAVLSAAHVEGHDRLLRRDRRGEEVGEAVVVEALVFHAFTPSRGGGERRHRSGRLRQEAPQLHRSAREETTVIQFATGYALGFVSGMAVRNVESA